MKKILLSILLIVSFANAKGSDVATKDDIRAVKDDIRAVKDEIIHQMDRQFEQIDKRFEQIDKRFEQMQHNLDKRFEQMQHNLDKRFEQMQHNLDKRFEMIDKRFEQMQHNTDKRFEDMNDRFNTLLTVLLFGFGLIVSIVGFYISKTYNIENEIKAVAYDVQKSHNKKYFEALIDTVEELAKKERVFSEILKKHELSKVA